MNKAVLITVLILVVSPLVSAEEIESCQELQNIEGGLDAQYRLTQDIDCSSVENFEPIGDYSTNVDESNSFEGVFDGQGHTIENLQINRPEDSQVGLFSGLLEGAEVKHVKIEASRIEGDVDVGGIVGRNDHGTIRRVSFNGEIEGTQNVGGIVGWNWGTISQVYSDGTVEGESSVGGIAGRNFAATIVAGYSLADVRGDETVGGVAGENLGVSTTVEKVFAAGDVEGNEKVGGALAKDNSYGASAYWNKETTGQEQSARGNSWSSENGLTTEQMTGQDAQDNLGGYDWGNTWGVPEEGNYPYLKAVQDSGIEAPSNTGSETCTYDFFGEVQGYTYQNDGVTGEVHIGDGSTQVTREGSFGFTKTAECGATATAEYIEEGETLASTDINLPEDSGEVSEIRLAVETSSDPGGEITQEIDLTGESWNNIGVNVEGVSLSENKGSCDFAPYETGGISGYAWTVEDGEWIALSQEDELSTTKGYSVYSKNDCTLTFEGSQAGTTGERQLSGEMWNLITLPPRVSPSDVQRAVESKGAELETWENEVFWTNLGIEWTHPVDELSDKRAVYVYPTESVTISLTGPTENPGPGGEDGDSSDGDD